MINKDRNRLEEIKDCSTTSIDVYRETPDVGRFMMFAMAQSDVPWLISKLEEAWRERDEWRVLAEAAEIFMDVDCSFSAAEWLAEFKELRDRK